MQTVMPKCRMALKTSIEFDVLPKYASSSSVKEALWVPVLTSFCEEQSIIELLAVRRLVILNLIKPLTQKLWKSQVHKKIMGGLQNFY